MLVVNFDPLPNLLNCTCPVLNHSEKQTLSLPISTKPRPGDREAGQADSATAKTV
ncbi:hypothetical protein PLO_2106 [Pediococcus acidilactici NGRI 0510Q]|nr:hypothetical protein HN015_00200 [Pediococcus acidilactici]GAC46634.1 hypothetical protein PLO_2106 [Pediococcus acidilactici NGRI 0510Q]